jgi:hypothetical protein
VNDIEVFEAATTDIPELTKILEPLVTEYAAATGVEL